MTSLTAPFLCKGIITPSVHFSGKRPDTKIPLNTSHKWADKISLHSRKYSFKIQSLPDDLLRFKCFIAFLTSSIDIGTSSSGNAEFSKLKSLFKQKSSAPV